MFTRSRHLLLFIASVALLAACTTTANQAQTPPTTAAPPSTTSTTQPTTTSTTPTARTFPQNTAFTPEQVCELITPTEAQALSLTHNGTTSLFDSPMCMLGGDGSRVSLSVDPRPLQGQRLSPEDKNTKTEISGRPALIIEDASKITCGVIVELTTKTTLTAQGGHHDQNIESHCQLVRQTINLALSKITN